MKIIEASNRRAIDALFATERERGPRLRAQGLRPHRAEGARQGGDKALLRFARQFDNLSQPVEVSREEMEARRRGCRPTCGSRSRSGKEHRAGGSAPDPEAFDVEVVPGVPVEQRVEPLESVGCYVPADGSLFPLRC